MRSAKTVRGLATDLLLERERDGGDITDLLKKALDACGGWLPPVDRAFLRKLCIGVVERLGSIDHCVDEVSSVKVSKMKPAIRATLRLGAYQILFMDKVRDAAAVDEAVKEVKKRGLSTLSGFINGVLRKLSREKLSLLDGLSRQEPCIRYSMPQYVWDLLKSERGEEAASRIGEELLRERPLTVRAAHGLISEGGLDPWLRDMSNAGVEVTPHKLLPFMYEVGNPGDVRLLPGFKEGKFMVQDAASALAVVFADLRKGESVLDVCAAPGGKAIFAAELIGDPSKVLARDSSAKRCELIRENAARMNQNGIEIECFDGTVFDDRLKGSFDAVFCDLPCTGFGVMGRKPEIKYKASKERTGALVELQRRILSVSAESVRPGGRLIYSTCTVSKEENEKNAEWFANGHGFELQGFEFDGGLREIKKWTRAGSIQLLPGEYGTDGFFVARFCRSRAPET